MLKLPSLSLSRNQVIMIGGGLALIVIVVVLLSFFSGKQETAAPVTLNVWGMDKPEAWKSILGGYKTLRPNATVIYTQVSSENYNDTLFKALASGKGPDVFLIGNHDLLSRSGLISPALSTQIVPADIQTNFPQAVLQDFTYKGSIYALPLYMDSMVMVYNKQILDGAGIALPPATWQEMLDVIPRLRVLDASGQISRSALAIGASERSVVHATDILNLIMLQNGTVMADDAGAPSFSRGAGPTAFQFYLSFADSASSAYTWNDAQGNSLESFIAQKTAMALVYQRDLNLIKKRAPFLNFAVAPVPQISSDKGVNYPNYQGLAAWVGSAVKPWAWDFIIFASTNSEAQKGYLAATGYPAALRTLIAEQSKDQDLNVFARGNLTARSWKVGDYDKIKTIFSNAIQNVQTGAKNLAVALKDAEAQANQIVPK